MKLLQVFSRINFYLGVDFSQIIEFIHVFCYLFFKNIEINYSTVITYACYASWRSISHPPELSVELCPGRSFPAIFSCYSFS